jgi:hypothetical protein
VQLENFRVGPHVGAVVIDEDSHVSNEAYARAPRSRRAGLPLLIKGELDGLLDLEIVPALLLQLEQRLGIAVRQLLRPGDQAPDWNLCRNTL